MTETLGIFSGRARTPITSIQAYGRRILIADQSLEHDIAKHAKEISLTHFAATTVGQHVFEFSDETRNGVMSGLDIKAKFQHAFYNPASHAELVSRSYKYIETAVNRLQDERVDLNKWVFQITARAVASSLYDKDSPWIVSDDTMSDLM
jgi:hypothetical protein